MNALNSGANHAKLVSSQTANNDNKLRPTTTPSNLLNQQLAWQSHEASYGLLEDISQQTLRLGEQGKYAISPKEPFGSFGGKTLARGVAISESGFMLVADSENNRVLYYDTLSSEQSTNEKHDLHHGLPTGFRELWQTPNQVNNKSDEGHETEDCLNDAQTKAQAPFYHLHKPLDIKLSQSGELVIADSGNHRVLIMSWPDLRVRHSIFTPGKSPQALELDEKGNIYIAYKNQARIVKYDYLWHRDPDYCAQDTGIQSPSALAKTIDNQLIVLCEQQMEVFALDAKGKVIQSKASAEFVFALSFIRPPLGIVQTDDQQDLLTYTQKSRPNCEPWYLRNIQVDSIGNIATTNMRLLTRPKVLRLPRVGEYFTTPFDSGNLGSQWHRVVLNASIPVVCKITLQTFTSDKPIDVANIFESDWSQPLLYNSNDRALDNQVQGLEALIQSGKGRYLTLRIGLYGDGIATPQIHDISIFSDRESSLAFLPEPYRQDPQSADFLDRWLSYFDTVQAEISALARDFNQYLDPQTVSSNDFLSWLGSWFNWTFLAEWPVETRREMIANSLSYYQMRGTLQGLKQMLQWHTGLSGEQPSIIEHYRLREQLEIEEDIACDSGSKWFIGQKPFTPDASQVAHWFSVIVPASAVPDQQAFDTLEAVITAQKPAHTGFRVCVISPGLRVGQQSSIGIDTWLGHYPDAKGSGFTLGQSSQLKSQGFLHQSAKGALHN
jgi:phage tail-like protein